MPQTTQKRLGVNMGVQLKGPRSKHRIDPYNMFTIHYTVTTTTVNSKELKREEGERTLSNPWLLGLNPAWLSRRAPDSRAANKSQKATIRSFIPNFPYWGYLIDHSIQEFNASSPHRCRKLVYDLRHGEADHNAWKKLYIERDEEFRWTKVEKCPKSPAKIHKLTFPEPRVQNAPHYSRRRQRLLHHRPTAHCERGGAGRKGK